MHELSNIRNIIQVVEDEDALQTTNVVSTLVRLKATEDKLVAWLKRVDPGNKSSAHQFSYQLVHGSKDRKVLADIMNELSRVKSDLCVDIQVAHVGVTQIVESGVIANSEVIRRIDRRLVQIFGEGKGLKIARLLKDRAPQSKPPNLVFGMFRD